MNSKKWEEAKGLRWPRHSTALHLRPSENLEALTGLQPSAILWQKADTNFGKEKEKVDRPIQPPSGLFSRHTRTVSAYPLRVCVDSAPPIIRTAFGIRDFPTNVGGDDEFLALLE